MLGPFLPRVLHSGYVWASLGPEMAMSLDEISCMCQHAWRIWLRTCKLALTLKYPREEKPLQDFTYYSSTNSTFWLNHWCKPWVPTTPPTLFLATQVNKARRSSWQTSNCRGSLKSIMESSLTCHGHWRQQNFNCSGPALWMVVHPGLQ